MVKMRTMDKMLDKLFALMKEIKKGQDKLEEKMKEGQDRLEEIKIEDQDRLLERTTDRSLSA